MKFTLRDLFWLMLVVGVATAWLIMLLAAPPKASTVKGRVYSRGKPFEGRIFLRSHDGVVISAPVHKGDFDLKYCTTGTYEVVYEGAEEDLRFLNDGKTIRINSYSDQFFGFGSSQDADPSMTVFPPIAKRRDNWRISREEELNE
jgi:hypothetical protein